MKNILTKKSVITFTAVAITAAAALLISTGCEEQQNMTEKQKPKGPVAVLQTNKGDIYIELYEEKAPKTVQNFLRYVNEGFYDGTVFHRVIEGFMIQGGGFTPNMLRKKTYPPIENEASNGLKNLRGTVAMARTNDPNSATSQFFINHADNPSLDYAAGNPGYAVFGKVIDGMSVVDEIATTPTTTKDRFQDVPVKAVVIIAAKEVE
jgi:cyclophilin family peptidyl-prolyl cis-trans isomerase